ncbi:MAG TPA: hypothetical protein PK800_04445 [Syntrophorhabdaceae bacterium]|nr:hypothetical protein [Syntrophorhabdaceae bacterium]
MQIDEKMVRDLRKKFEIELNKREIEILQFWRQEIENLYKRKYESIGSLQVNLKELMERMGNRINLLQKMIKQG